MMALVASRPAPSFLVTGFRETASLSPLTSALQLALDTCKRRGVPLSLQKADIIQAYFEAPLPADRLLLAAIPPSDHSDHGQYLWVLQKAVYGLPDAGQVFEDFFISKLTELRWTTGLFPGVWFLCNKDGKLRGIVATYVDDLLILGIGEDAASLVDPLKDFITYGDYTKLTKGRFVGVQFEVTTDRVFTHQIDYISSLFLPPEHIGSSFKPANKPLPVGSTHKDDVSPPLDSRGASLFRTLLG
uniref:Reverse transcriptase Ty1/copia-type domain-containing protein n=1 Tax=Chromera velia CCMP2878 TaxID=1169474 RepID=A0A0G4HZ96_9ALVE|eukprot:Cvel_9685.t1-p1 / transcript=Cvel_9685.t1 / gene=Cvel_9685 / organism=Chromera_velia_CCMP2878 / gene_product=hypothetical protein / transcript_product=hypothetical protein / location=Cvel_scaffold564:35309-36037(+) / protein_length=243 / sequence_SO=supercontig / SO=protein_coding / is_pseudo=false